MLSRLNPWLLGGIGLDLIGIFLIVQALPDGGMRLAAGVACLAAGTAAISLGARGDSGPRPDVRTLETARGGWRPEPELRQEPPRAVKLAPAAMVSIVSWLLAAAVVGFFVWDRVAPLSPASREQRLLAAEGESAEATVHRKETRESTAGEPRYQLYYNFRGVDGGAVRSSATVSRRVFERYEVGDEIEVRYLPGDPVMHYLPPLERSDTEVRIALAAAVLAAFFLFLLEAKRRRHKKLVRDGKAVPGVVVGVKVRGAARAATVAFETLHEKRELRATLRRPALEKGDAATVLYDPSDPREAELYAACLYRAVQRG